MQYSSNLLITIIFGVIGGLRKAFQLSFVFIQINISSVIAVIAYAALSAVVGYFVKILMDRIRLSIQKLCYKTKSKHDE